MTTSPLRLAFDRKRQGRQQRHARAARHHLDESGKAARTEVRCLFDPDPITVGERLVPKTVAVFEQEHRLAGEIRFADASSPRQWMRDRRGHDEWVLEERECLYGREPGLQREEQQVELAELGAGPADRRSGLRAAGS